ncbi:nucleoside-diphosphate kinase [Candidatus Thorarchaeota archaeon]|jgi:nucleoside-diphosphate kinase|nr:MAG: nucleoside-diphosphate kinase [Candidatus Thorarchaeota archaeon]
MYITLACAINEHTLREYRWADLEQSLVIIKPDGTARRRVSALVLKALLDRGYKVAAFQEMKVPESLAEKHYAVHKEKPFFPWLVEFISSAPVIAMILEAEDVIQGVRDALGATFVQKASPDSLRGKYGIWAGINIAHASDAPETALKEIELWTTDGGLEIGESAEEEARKYIEKYGDGSADYTMAIRNIVKESIANKDTSRSVLHSLEDLIAKDASGISEADTDALAKAVFSFIQEEAEKE